MSDFKIIRGRSTIPGFGFQVTITEGVDYTLEPGMDNTTCFIRITNSRLTGMGRSDAGVNTPILFWGVWINNPSNIATSITFEMGGFGAVYNDCEISWEIIQYIGASGGANEFIVRSVQHLATSGVHSTITGATINTISDINKVCCFLTGQGGAIAVTGRWCLILYITEMIANGSDWDPRARREISASSTDEISLAVVEFTGSNWRDVQRVEFTDEGTIWDSGAGQEISFTKAIPTALLDASKAFLHVQYTTDNDPTGIEDAGDTVELTDSLTELTCRNRTQAGVRRKCVWIIEHSQEYGADCIYVEHVTYFDAGTGTNVVRNLDKTIEEVTTDEASVMGECCSMYGTGTAVPRGNIDAYILNSTTLRCRESNAWLARRFACDIVSWTYDIPEPPSPTPCPDKDLETSWTGASAKYTNAPAVLCEIDLGSGYGIRKHSIDYIRPTNASPYIGDITSFPKIYQSIGDIRRSFELSNIEIILSDTERYYHALVETMELKNKPITIKISFINLPLSATLSGVGDVGYIKIFEGWIYDWEILDDLKFKIICEHIMKNMDKQFPDERVKKGDYGNADGSAIGKSILIPYGTISALGDSNDGAFGHPSLFEVGKGGLPMIDNTVDSEKHLVGRQAYEEILPNPSFDVNTSGWGAVNSAILASVAGGKNGTNCLSITEGGNNYPYTRENITVIPGVYYWFRVYVKAGTEDYYRVHIRDDSNGAYIITGTWIQETAGDWSTVVDYIFQAPVGCTNVRIMMYSQSLNGEGKTIYYDEAMLTEAIGIPRVYIDAVLKTEGSGNDYQLSYQFIDDFIHAEIHWEIGVNPTVDNIVSCDIKFGERTPVEGIRNFMEKFAGYESSRFNTPAYNEAIALEVSRGYTFHGVLWQVQPKKVLRTILDDWRDEFELEIFPNKEGEIIFKYISSTFAVGANEYSDLREILPPFQSKRRISEILNKLRYGYEKHFSRTYWNHTGEYEDTLAQAKFGGIVYDDFKGFDWIRDAGMANDIASRKVMRFKNAITFDRLTFPLKTFADDLADVIKVTHFKGKGSSGYVNKFMQIRSMEFDLDNYTNTMLLEDATNFIGSSCILGDETVLPAKWTDASGAERDYCYMCDYNTGQFSDGQPGKRMFD